MWTVTRQLLERSQEEVQDEEVEEEEVQLVVEMEDSIEESSVMTEIAQAVMDVAQLVRSKMKQYVETEL